MPVSIKSSFKPMTYDEITKPLILATEALNALEDAYIETSDKAALAMALANLLTDPIAYNKLKLYSEDLKYLADLLLRNGLLSGSRSALLNIRRRYGNEVIPIELAISRRKELADELKKFRLLNPDMLFERDMNGVSLDDLISNPNMDYGKSYSGLQLQKDVSDIVSAVGKNLGNILMGRSVDKYTKELILKSGFTVDEILLALLTTDKNTLLGLIAEGVLQKSGIYLWGDLNTINRARLYAQNGFWGGVGEIKRTAIDNYEAKRKAELEDYNKKLEFKQGTNSTKQRTNSTVTINGDNYTILGKDANGTMLYKGVDGKTYEKTVGSNGKVTGMKLTNKEVKSPTTSKPVTRRKAVSYNRNGSIEEIENPGWDMSLYGTPITNFLTPSDSDIEKIDEKLKGNSQQPDATLSPFEGFLTRDWGGIGKSDWESRKNFWKRLKAILKDHPDIENYYVYIDDENEDKIVVIPKEEASLATQAAQVLVVTNTVPLDVILLEKQE